MWRRRDCVRLGVSAWLAGAAPLAWSQRTGDVRPSSAARAPLGQVVLAVENRSSLCYLPLTVAERRGFFEAEGLDLRVREVGSQDELVQAMLSGAAQVASGPYSHAIHLQTRGHDLRSFVVQGRTPQLVMGVSQRTLAHYRQPQDLRGHRLAVTALGSASYRVARLVLAKAGVGANEVAFQAFDDASMARAAFRAGAVDALCYHDPLVTQLEQDGELRVVADTRTQRGNADVFGGPLPAGSLCASGAFLNDSPAQCQAMANAMVRALKWLQTAGPSDLIRTVPEPYFQGDRSLYLAAFSRAREAWVPDGLMPEGGPQTVQRMLAQFGDAPQLARVDLERTYTDRYAREAKQRLRA